MTQRASLELSQKLQELGVWEGREPQHERGPMMIHDGRIYWEVVKRAVDSPFLPTLADVLDALVARGWEYCLRFDHGIASCLAQRAEGTGPWHQGVADNPADAAARCLIAVLQAECAVQRSRKTAEGIGPPSKVEK